MSDNDPFADQLADEVYGQDNGRPWGSTLTKFSDVIAKPVRWLWRDRIALGKITGVGGRPKIGKVTRGGLDGNLDGPRNCIIVTTEDAPEDTLKPRLMAAGADLERVSYFTMGTEEDPVPFRIPQDAEELGRRLALAEVALVVIDPLIEFVDGKVDSHKSQPVRQAMSALNTIAREHDCAILALVHLNKGASTDPLDRWEASAAFFQVFRAAMMLGRDPDDPEGETGDRRVLASVASNLAREAPSRIYRIEGKTVDADEGDETINTARIVYLEDSSISSSDLLTRMDEEARAERDEAVGFLDEELPPGSIFPAAKIQAQAKEAGIGPGQLKRAKRALRIRSHKPDFETGWVWERPGLGEGDAAPKGTP
jgi:AAA domain